MFTFLKKKMGVEGVFTTVLFCVFQFIKLQSEYVTCFMLLLLLLLSRVSRVRLCATP